MISKINELKGTTTNQTVISLCEVTTAMMSSTIYNNVTNEARYEIERVALEKLFEGLAKVKNDKLVTEWLSNQQRLFAVKNIGVRAAIASLRENEGKTDPTLAALLERLQEKVDQYPEVLIYEEVISALAGEYNYVPGVQTQLDAIANRVNNYKNDIDITKIIETMRATKSNYLLPLIEDVVNSYVANKTEQTKSHLKETLVKFSYDPFVRDLINIIMLDAKDLQLEYANGESDIDKVYSPLMYLGENEVAFNIKGTYYIKKGNNVNKLKKAEALHLDENFRGLCEIVNLPNVEIGKKEIKLFVGNDLATITEANVEVNTHVMNEQQLKDQAEVSQWTGNAHFYQLAEALHTNFNEIVEVDFAKRVYMKMDECHAADVMKLRGNIYITTYDPLNNKSTFFRNVNPIQAEKIMMEHMRFDVSNTFADILPDKEKQLASIAESKKEFVAYIEKLNERINQFEMQTQTPDVLDVLSILNEELREVKNDYKDYSNDAETYTSISEGVTVSIDVDGQKYTVPIPEPTSTAKGEEKDNTAGEVIGAEYMEDAPSTEITFDDDQTELLGDSPSIQDDQVDLGVDNVEAQADAAEADAEDGEDGAPADGGEVEGEAGGDEGPIEGGEDIDLGTGGDEEVDSDDDLGLGDEEDAEETDEDKETPELEKMLKDDSTNPEAAEDAVEDFGEEELDAIETEGAPEELEGGDLEDSQELAPAVEDDEEVDLGDAEELGSEDGEVEVEDAEVKTKPVNAPKVFLVKKKVVESVMSKKKLNANKLNEDAQILDRVTVNGEKGSVIGQLGNGDLLVQVQYSTKQAKPGDVKRLGEKKEVADVPYKFDPKTLQNLTTKALFEQFVKCGIYVGSTPVKLNESYVKYSDYLSATDPESPLNVIIEGDSTVFPKKHIRILENVNDFANPAAFEWGIFTNSEGVSEDVLVNGEEFMQAYGESHPVTIIRNISKEAIVEKVSRDMVQPNTNEEAPIDGSQFQ